MDAKFCINCCFRGYQSSHPLRVREVFSNLKINAEDLAPLLTPPSEGEAYGRTDLYTSSHLMIVALLWRANHAPGDIHDHGPDAWGLIQVIQGAITNRTYALNEYGVLETHDTEEKKAGDECLYLPRGIIHSMQNNGPRETVTLHAYSPSIRDSRVYQQDTVYPQVEEAFLTSSRQRLSSFAGYTASGKSLRTYETQKFIGRPFYLGLDVETWERSVGG